VAYGVTIILAYREVGFAWPTRSSAWHALRMGIAWPAVAAEIYTVIAISLVLGRPGLSPFRGAMGTAGVAERTRLERVQPGRDVPGMPIVLCLSRNSRVGLTAGLLKAQMEV
jgi:hypothetical protein